MKRVFAHRYKWSHEKRRKVLRKALKQDKIQLLETLHDGWLYLVPDDFKVPKTR